MRDVSASAHPDVAPRRTHIPWVLAVAGVVAGVVLISVAARFGGNGEGPLRPVVPTGGDPWSRLDREAPAAVAVRLERFAHQSFTRTGARWHVDAAALVTDNHGVLLMSPVLEMHRGAVVVARLKGDTARLRPGERALVMEGGAVLEVGDELRVETEHLSLQSDGTVTSAGAITISTPHGLSRGDGVRIEPAEGKVIVAPGTAGEEVLRWSGWGREFVDLGEAVRNWSRSSLPRQPTQLTAAAD